MPLTIQDSRCALLKYKTHQNENKYKSMTKNNPKKYFIDDKIGETLLITLYMKSIESKNNNAILKDPTAVKLIDIINYDFDKFKKAQTTAIGVVIRAKYFDDMLISFIEKNQRPVIVIIGCGLDSRYDRISKHIQDAVFYQLDMPEVINIRNKYIPPKDNETYISESMLGEEWMKKIKNENQSSNFLFIIEGVLMYFSKKEVQTLFKRLAKEFSNSELLFDITSVWLSKNSHLQDSVKLMRANFNYGTDNDKEMEFWADNLQHISTKLYTDFDTWKRMGIKGYIMNFFPKFKNAGRMLRYKII